MRWKGNLFFQWPIVTFVVSLIVSVAMYMVFPPAVPQNIRFVYFPNNFGEEFQSEIRTVPRKKNLQSAIRSYVEELILGPVSLDFSRALPPKTQVKHVILSDKRLYIDFSYGILSKDSDFHTSLEAAMENLRRGIKKNFPAVEDIFLSIEGQEVFFLGRQADN